MVAALAVKEVRQMAYPANGLRASKLAQDRPRTNVVARGRRFFALDFRGLGGLALNRARVGLTDALA